VAIGELAGETSQGNNAIAIGFGAGYTNQPAKSIVINASGVTIDGRINDACYIAPLRSNPATSNPGSVFLVYYNPTTKELFFK
jgi:hypothetical protein